MHPISDKELDKLFQRGFEEAEFQPSEKVWGKIAAKMDGESTVRKPLPVFWMAAASVVVLIGATMWFKQPVEVIRLQGAPQQMVQDARESDVQIVAPEAPIIEPEQTIIKGFDFSKLTASEPNSLNTPGEVTLPERIVEEAPRHELIAVNQSRKSPELAQGGKEVSVPRYSGDQSQLDVTQPDLIASADLPEEDVPSESTPLKRVRGIAGIINMVISKVDHREDKIIEFKDGEEGSEVSGINLGLIRLKSRNR
jgi:hypothetical protein